MRKRQINNEYRYIRPPWKGRSCIYIRSYHQQSPAHKTCKHASVEIPNGIGANRSQEDNCKRMLVDGTKNKGSNSFSGLHFAEIVQFNRPQGRVWIKRQCSLSAILWHKYRRGMVRARPHKNRGVSQSTLDPLQTKLQN